jgi:hypothetical protein
MRYVGLAQYKDRDIESICTLASTGVILGDILCNERMFVHGGAELPEIMRLLRKRGVPVIYQTPMYATDNRITDMTHFVEYCCDRGFIDAAIVQDIGVASVLRERCGGLSVIWGRMGYARIPVVNSSTAEFFMEHGVTGFECGDIHHAKYLNSLGATVYYLVGIPQYLSINRECYCKFEHDVFDGKCGRRCLKREKLVIPTDPPLETTMDGHLLGWQNAYVEHAFDQAAQFENCVVYADSLATAQDKLSHIITAKELRK